MGSMFQLCIGWKEPDITFVVTKLGSQVTHAIHRGIIYIYIHYIHAIQQPHKDAAKWSITNTRLDSDFLNLFGGSYIPIFLYITRVKAEGSPEANCILFVWIWKMLFLHCILQCFMLSSEIVRSVQVAISARINLTLQFQLQRSNILKVSTAINPT